MQSTGLPESLALIANHGALGGGEVMALRMAGAAVNAGLSVDVLAPALPNELANAAEAHGLCFHGLSAETRRGQLIETIRALRRSQPQMVWCNGPYPALALPALTGVRVIHLHQAPTRLQAAALFAPRRVATATVVPSLTMQRSVSASVACWNWGEDLELTTPPTNPDGPLRVGFLGRFSPVKGLDVLASAMQLLDAAHRGSVQLLLAGDYRFVPGRAADRVRNALQNVQHLLTNLGWSSPSELLSSIDVLVVPSKCNESFGLVVLEAMAARVPVVVSAAGALPEIVGAEHPWIVRTGDAQHLAEMLTSLRLNPRQRIDSVRAARKRWEQLFSPTAGRRRYLNLVSQIHSWNVSPRSAHSPKAYCDGLHSRVRPRV